ncbi:MAG: DMT family transporter [Alphaproteobacteria bacterium GM202ARS2]|nr:DMT family transporter [Alphaproteobacteria bacterium GM202ARS2]
MAQKYTSYDFSLLFSLSLVWSLSFIFIKVAVETMPPLAVVTLRMLIACVLFFVYMSVKTIDWRSWLPLWRVATPVALTGYVIPYMLISWSTQHVESYLPAVMIGLVPLLAMLFAHFFTDDERLNWQRALAIVCGLGGIFAFKIDHGMEMVDNHDGESHMAFAVLPLAALFLSVVSYAANIAMGRRLKGLSPTAVQGVASYIGLLIILPFMLIYESDFFTDGIQHVSLESWAATLALGTFVTVLSSIMFYVLIGRSGMIFASLVDYVIPFFGVILGYLILDETINEGTFIALPLIMVSFAIMYTQAPTTAQHINKNGGKHTDKKGHKSKQKQKPPKTGTISCQVR